ncbi:PAS domain-containing protein [Sphingomonas sp. CARO-RG-8B-R24-01]|uniref:PAS domain-containing protein n=1 Tax=Sphingomonas sp. CARO-RG-8B-R24-01 TaxID=2914831 RepID=UPI001F580AD1|nr:PAS domain-containing protein [Sphingomonas sp. CARO-RG-8B-R24-01]
MNRTLAEGAIILAPRGRDAAIAQAMLVEGRMEAAIAPDLAALVAALRSGSGFAIVTEEALRSADLRELTVVLAGQAEWSDLPFIVLTERGGGLERNPGAVRLLETLGNVTFLERPFHPTTLLSLARAARRARLRQYEARNRLEDIHAGQERLKLAIAAGGLGAWTLDMSTSTLHVEPDTKAQFGRGPDEPFDYLDLLAAIHPDDRDDTIAGVQRAMADHSDYRAEVRCVWPDGSLHWLQVDGRVERDRAGKPRRVVGVSHEITDRRVIELRQRALLALSDRLREAPDTASMSFEAAAILGSTLGVCRAGYGVIDPVAETITIERDWCMPGIQTLAGVLHFRDYGSYIENLKRGELVAFADARTDPRTAESASALEAIAARAVINLPLVERGTFSALLYLSHAHPRAWSDDDLTFVRDVADRTQAAIERRRAEDALAALAETLERQVEERTRERDRTWQNSQDMLAILSEDGMILSVNPAWTSVLGWNPDEIIGRNHLAFAHPDEVSANAAARESALRGNLRQYENRYRHKDGSYRWIGWVATLEGNRLYASGRHITAERAAQADLESAQEQLRQAQKMEAVGQLTGGLAHDFNNLLTAISGSLELIQTRILQGRANELDRYVNMAQQAARRAAALTHRLLAFSRRQTLDPRPTDINRLIASFEDLLRRSVGPSVEIEIVGAAGLWTTLVDPNQLENAVLNLCINARDAMPDGGRITIETANIWLDATAARTRDMAAGQYISVCVTDTGSGMTPETIARAFDPFFTTKPLGEGTGLGLSMIYGFVRQSGGQVRIYSELGSGTTMCLYLPRSYDAEEPDLESQPTLDATARATGKTVLVVDDEPAVRALVVDTLVDLGHHVLEAGDGPSAVTLLDSDRIIDLMITDVGLPKGMNGRQLADVARVRRPDLKILFITGYAENAAVGNGHLDPGMHILTKPFAMDALSARIQQLTTD